MAAPDPLGLVLAVDAVGGGSGGLLLGALALPARGGLGALLGLGKRGVDPQLLVATPRLTELVDAEVEIEDEALIEREDVAITVTHAGYIKRTPIAEYRVQGRGGKGRAGMVTREEDFVTNLFVASTHA